MSKAPTQGGDPGGHPKRYVPWPIPAAIGAIGVLYLTLWMLIKFLNTFVVYLGSSNWSNADRRLFAFADISVLVVVMLIAAGCGRSLCRIGRRRRGTAMRRTGFVYLWCSLLIGAAAITFAVLGIPW